MSPRAGRTPAEVQPISLLAEQIRGDAWRVKVGQRPRAQEQNDGGRGAPAPRELRLELSWRPVRRRQALRHAKTRRGARCPSCRLSWSLSSWGASRHWFSVVSATPAVNFTPVAAFTLLPSTRRPPFQFLKLLGSSFQFLSSIAPSAPTQHSPPLNFIALHRQACPHRVFRPQVAIAGSSALCTQRGEDGVGLWVASPGRSTMSKPLSSSAARPSLVHRRCIAGGPWAMVSPSPEACAGPRPTRRCLISPSSSPPGAYAGSPLSPARVSVPSRHGPRRRPLGWLVRLRTHL
jgi:hypothetical protein